MSACVYTGFYGNLPNGGTIGSMIHQPGANHGIRGVVRNNIGKETPAHGGNCHIVL